MKGFQKLFIFGILLVTLFLVIQSIDAAKKNDKKTLENEDKTGKYKVTVRKSHQGIPKKNENSNANWQSSENLKGSKTEAKKYKLKKGSKYTSSKESPKITKTYEKVKKYKIVENKSAQKINSEKPKQKRQVKVEHADKIYKAPRKELEKREPVKEEKPVINQVEERVIREEQTGSQESPLVKKKYKLVEIILEEDGEGENETVIEVGSEDGELQRTESEEVIEKYKTTQTVKIPKTKNSGRNFEPLVDEEEEELEDVHEENLLEEIPEDIHAEIEKVAARYQNPEKQACQRTPENLDQVGPKKLTLYVVEEEIDGRIMRRVIPEEEGVTMCEVADLLKDNYYEGLI